MTMDNNNNLNITITIFNELWAYRKSSWKPCTSDVAASSSVATLFDCCWPTLTIWRRLHFRTPVYCRFQNIFSSCVTLAVLVVSLPSLPPIHMMLMILFSISPPWMLHREWLASLHLSDAIASLLAAWKLLQGKHYSATLLPYSALPSISACSSCCHPDCWVHFSWQQLAVATLPPVYCCLSKNSHFLLFCNCFIIFANNITPSLAVHWLLRIKNIPFCLSRCCIATDCGMSCCCITTDCIL